MKRFLCSLILLVLAGLSPVGAGRPTLLGAGSGVFIPPPTPLLDTLTATAKVAYSTRKLRAAYAGAALQARNAGAATQDIGFNSNNDLDTGALNTFCGASACTVAIWYDQMALANAVQASATNQPRILAAGNVLDTINSHGALKFGFSGSANMTFSITLISQPITIALAAVHNSQVASGHYTDGITASPREIIGVSGTTAYTLYAGTSINGGTLDTTTHALIGIFNNTTSSLIVDGSTILSGTASTQGMAGQSIGAGNGGAAIHPMDGQMGEYIVFNSAISGGDQGLIRTSWQSYWGTP